MKHPSTHTVYILHGWAVDPLNEQKWDAVRSLLDKKNIESTFLPIPGLTSPLPDSKAWSLSDYVRWLSAELPQGKRVILLGHSFGGQLSVRFTKLFPKRVESLILIASSGIRDHSLRARTKRAVFYVLAKVGKVLGFLPFTRTLLYTLAREKDYYQAPTVMKETMSQVIAEEIRDDLPQIAVPTLAVWGEQDRVTPVRNLEFFRRIPELTVQLIPEARHSPQFTHPAQVADGIARFLAEK